MSVDQIFPFEIDLTTERKELAFIETGIETLVVKIYEKIYNHAGTDIEKQKDKLKEVTRLDLNEIENKANILKVGSFYEGTKILSPDEFDFILIFGTFEMPKEEIADHKFGFGSLFIYGEIERILTKKELSEDLYFIKCETESAIIFDKFVSNNGPALKLKFSYIKQSCNAKEIYVDLVPAFKIVDKFIDMKIDKMCSSSEFGKAIIDSGSFLITKLFISFTETEVEFMKNQLSQNHFKAYKLLKYLINGNNVGEKLKTFCATKDLDDIHISSYKIKTCMIMHHYSCHPGDGSVVNCICDVLCDIYTSWKGRRWPNLVAGLDMRVQYHGSYRHLNRGRKYREKGQIMLENLLEHLSIVGKASNLGFKYTLEPWAISVLREAEVKGVMEDILNDVEFAMLNSCASKQQSILAWNEIGCG